MLDALAMRPMDRPPVWFMRQAGRYLPEYRELRLRHEFQEAVHSPALAAEITLQPVRRFDLDAAVLFSDIMTPLEGMGVDVEFAPGPTLTARSLQEVADLPEIALGSTGFVFETLQAVRAELPEEVALIGFCGAPFTLMAYLMEGSGSKDFPAVRSALAGQPGLAAAAMASLAQSMRRYLVAQIDAGADVVQVFDSWAGLLPQATFIDLVVPAIRSMLADLGAPSIYFAPHATHLLDGFAATGAVGYGVDWRQPIRSAWDRIGHAHPIQGNLDPAVLLTDPATVEREVASVLAEIGGAPGHIFNLGHGIHRSSPIENVEAMVASVRRGTS